MAAQLWLLRHGDAVPHGAAGNDADRPLTARGEQQARAAGRALHRLEVTFDAVYTSPKVRAHDTARLACEGLDSSSPIVHEPLREGFSVSDARELMLRSDGDGHILVVGHNPDFAQVVYDFTGARIDFKKGAVAAVRERQLIVLLRPRELEALA